MSSEIAPSTPWRKSSYSTADETTTCVELAAARRVVAVRDSKHPDGPALRLSSAGFRSLLQGLRNT